MRILQNGDCFALASNARYFPHALGQNHEEIVFLPTTRRVLSASAFVDGRTPLLSEGEEESRVSLEGLQKAFETSTPISGARSYNFIFHTGFCCSTLLARCLDSKGACLSLKEPNILNDLSEFKRLGIKKTATGFEQERLSKLVFNLLFRRFSENEAVLVKPSNVNNNLIEDVLRLNPDAKLLFMYSDLKSFLIAVAKGGKPRRDFIRCFVASLLTDQKNNLPPGEQALPFSEDRLWNLSDLHIAAVAWHLQMQLFEEIESRFPGAKVMKLDCEEFLSDPPNTTRSLAEFFKIQLGMSKKEKENWRMNLSHHAKAQEFSYSATIRQTEFMAIENYLGKNLEEVITWVDDFLAPSRFPNLPKVAI